MTDVATPITRTSIASQVEGRLTLTTAVPVTTSDVTGATTVYFTPYTGDRISLLVGSRWVSRKFTEKSLTAQASLFRIMDVFGYDSSGTLALEQLAWDSGGQTTGTITALSNAAPCVATSTAHGLSNGDHVGVSGVGGNTACNGKVWRVANKTADTFECEGSVGNGAFSSNGTWYKVPASRTTAIVLTGTNATGVYTKTGDATRKYLGTYMTFGTSGQTEDSDANGLIWNMYNRVLRKHIKSDTNSHTYATATTRYWNNDPSNRIQHVVGLVEDALFGAVEGGIAPAAAGTEGIIGFALNQVTLAGQAAASNANAQKVYAGVPRATFPSLGFNYMAMVEYAAGANVTFNACHMTALVRD